MVLSVVGCSGFGAVRPARHQYDRPATSRMSASFYHYDERKSPFRTSAPKILNLRLVFGGFELLPVRLAGVKRIVP